MILKKISFEVFRFITIFNKQSPKIGTKKITKPFTINRGYLALWGAEVGFSQNNSDVIKNKENNMTRTIISNIRFIFIVLFILMVQFTAINCKGGLNKEPLLIYEAPDKEPVIAIACDNSDNVYAVTIKGNLVKIASDGTTKQLYSGLKRCGFSNRCLAILPNGDVVTNDCEGYKDVLVKIDENGKKEILLKLENSLNCLAADASGIIYLGYWVSEGNLTVSQFLQRADYLKGVIAQVTADNQLKQLYEGGVPQGLAVSNSGELYVAIWGEKGPFRPKAKTYSMCGPTRNFWIAMSEQTKILKLTPGGEAQPVTKELTGCSYFALNSEGHILAFGKSADARCGLYKIQAGQTPIRKVFQQDDITNNLTSLAVSKNYLFFSDSKKGIYKVGLKFF
jgi:hypothetical protein